MHLEYSNNLSPKIVIILISRFDIYNKMFSHVIFKLHFFSLNIFKTIRQLMIKSLFKQSPPDFVILTDFGCTL